MSISVIPLVTIVLALGGSLIWALVSTITQMAITISRQRAEASLKLEMIRRGYTASDIERICNVQVPAGTKFNMGDWSPVTPPPKPAKV
jgi:ABC-type nitrate/sulfonate/bicarbonate transport system permease component